MPNERPPTSSDLHCLLDVLSDLQARMKSTDGTPEGKDILKMYDYFIRSSNKGRHCTYSYKCEHLFKEHMYSDLRSLVHQIHELFQQIDKQ